jgi:sugar O-acyltransferase (sialic acid O-acetyltransferase NeuD family)
MNQKIAVYGASGFGRETMPLIRAQYPLADPIFIDDDKILQGTLINGVPVASFEQACEDRRDICLAIASPSVRKILAERCAAAGLAFVQARAADAVQYDRVSIGEGAILCARSMITSDVTIGRHFHANIYSYVAHDCVIGDFVTFAPRVCCNGRVVIEDGVYVGTGAMLRQGEDGAPLVIGRGAVIGMGAVVLKNVAPGVTVVGNPARPLTR